MICKLLLIHLLKRLWVVKTEYQQKAISSPESELCEHCQFTMKIKLALHENCRIDLEFQGRLPPLPNSKIISDATNFISYQGGK